MDGSLKEKKAAVQKGKPLRRPSQAVRQVRSKKGKAIKIVGPETSYLRPQIAIGSSESTGNYKNFKNV